MEKAVAHIRKEEILGCWKTASYYLAGWFNFYLDVRVNTEGLSGEKVILKLVIGDHCGVMIPLFMLFCCILFTYIRHTIVVADCTSATVIWNTVILLWTNSTASGHDMI